MDKIQINNYLVDCQNPCTWDSEKINKIHTDKIGLSKILNWATRNQLVKVLFISWGVCIPDVCVIEFVSNCETKQGVMIKVKFHKVFEDDQGTMYVPSLDKGDGRRKG